MNEKQTGKDVADMLDAWIRERRRGEKHMELIIGILIFLETLQLFLWSLHVLGIAG